jgi:hypothetical protein
MYVFFLKLVIKVLFFDATENKKSINLFLFIFMTTNN